MLTKFKIKAAGSEYPGDSEPKYEHIRVYSISSTTELSGPHGVQMSWFTYIEMRTAVWTEDRMARYLERVKINSYYLFD